MLPLRTTLYINGISSGITGIALMLFAEPVSRLFEVSTVQPFVYTGLFLVVFAGFVLLTARKKTIVASSVKLITTLDTIWVIASIALVAMDGSYMSVIGNIAIIAVAVWVALMAILQTKRVNVFQSSL